VKNQAQNSLAIFETYKIRRIYDEQKETWYFNVVDIVQALIQQDDYQTARKYWNKLKERLVKEGNQSVSNCHQLKFMASDGKYYATDAASMERLVSERT
jgi:nitrite reductase/ring-hydroxylating ferredoxin subunit